MAKPEENKLPPGAVANRPARRRRPPPQDCHHPGHLDARRHGGAGLPGDRRHHGRGQRHHHASQSDEAVEEHAEDLVRQGRRTFRFDTFGDQKFWGDTLRLHRAIAGARQRRRRAGRQPQDRALGRAQGRRQRAAGRRTRRAAAGTVDLDDPAVTLALLKLNSVVGVKGFFASDGSLRSVGIECALCHSTVDDSFAPGIGKRLDGWANRDLNVGAIVSLSPNLQPVADLLHTDVATVKTVLAAWGPGKFDAQLFLDGKAFRPDGRTAATLIPPAFGLLGVNQPRPPAGAR